MEKKDIMNVPEVADLLGFTPETVRRWHRLGRLRSLRFGRELRFRRSDVINASDRYAYGDDKPKHDPSMG